nr:DNA polymerase III subunit gamma and tau [Nocardia bovistercoris]
MYRKYRPATFAEVVGQEHVTDPLSTALDTGRISHAYLFSGPRGCGKTSSARILARSLNCEHGPTSTPCGLCSSCVALGPGGPGNIDVIELDAASHGGVDDTRELRDRAFYAPAESRYRVFIVDEAHMVTTAGFNALLKIVEEPPAHLIFIFATTEPDKVLATIRSRTHHYPFRLLPPVTMRGLLGRICEQESVAVEEAVYPLVIRAGGGSPRDSLSVLDQLLAGAGPEGVTYGRAVSLLGVTDVALIDDAVEALAADDGAALFGTVDQVMEAGHDPRRFAVDLLERFRDLILLRAVPDATDRGLVSGPGDVLDRMHDQAERIGPATLTRYAELLHAGLGEMRGATAPRLLLEVVCARMLLPSVSDAESATLQRLERLERGIATGAVASGAVSSGAAVPAGASSGAGTVAPAARPVPAEPGRRRGAEALAAMRGNQTADASGSTKRAGAVGDDEVAARSPAVAPADSRAAATTEKRASELPPLQDGGGSALPRGENQAGGSSEPPESAPDFDVHSRVDRGGGSARSDSDRSDPARGAGDRADRSGDDPRQTARPDADPTPPRTSPASAAAEVPAVAGAAPDSEPANVSARVRPDAVSGRGDVGSAGPASPPEPKRREVAGARRVAGQDRRGGIGDVGSEARPGTEVLVGADEPVERTASERQALPDGSRAESDRAGRAPESAYGARGSEGQRRQSVPETESQGRGSGDAGRGGASGAERADSGGGSAGASGAELLRTVEGAWGDIRAKVREFGAAVHALLSGASISRIEGEVIVFGHQHAPLAQRLSEPRNLEAVRSAVRAVLGREYEVRWESGAGAARPSTQQAARPRAGGGAPSAPARGGQGRGGAAAAGGRKSEAPAAPRYSRPSQANKAAEASNGSARPANAPRSFAGEDEIPPPDYPDLPDDPGPGDYPPPDPSADYERTAPAVAQEPTPEEEQEMFAEAARPVAPEDRRDPDEVALELLRDELGATRLDG